MSDTGHRLRSLLLLLIIVFFAGHAWAQQPRPWLQPPGFLIYTNDPDLRGGNRASNVDWNWLTETHQPVVADDFMADGYRISRVRWWGSYLPGYEPSEGTNFFEDVYVLSFFHDHTTRPSTLMGTYIAPITSVTIVPTPFTGGDGHAIFQYEVQLNQTCLAYQGLPDAEPAGFHGAGGRRYWLSIQAGAGRTFTASTNQSGSLLCVYETTTKTATNNFWGWHTSPTNRESASVSAHAQASGTNLAFPSASWQVNAGLGGEIDQAFEIWSECDQRPPMLAAVRGYCAENLLKVTFTEKVDPSRAGDAFNYVVTTNEINAGYVADVRLDSDQRSVWVVLFPEHPLPCGVPLTLSAFGIGDLCVTVAPKLVSLPFECAPCLDSLPGICPPISLAYERLGPFVSLRWDSTNYVLQSAPLLNEPWTVAASKSPLVVGPSTATVFYRLKCLSSP